MDAIIEIIVYLAKIVLGGMAVYTTVVILLMLQEMLTNYWRK